MKRIGNITLVDPSNLTNTSSKPAWTNYFLPIYQHLYNELPAAHPAVTPLIDFDILKTQTQQFQGLKNIGNDLFANKPMLKLLRSEYNNITTLDDWRKNPARAVLTHFLHIFPEFCHLIQNINIKTDLAIEGAKLALGNSVNEHNFMEFKCFLDKINRKRWPRVPTGSEGQSNTSILGTTSEKLLELALSTIIDDSNFFKVNNDKVSSYGDFVLMCLPNNLWLSVKSNFARERLLASGYTTDIVGVGYFTESSEFTSLGKIRNFQRVGFLAMYIPDIPISEKQVANNENTYDQVVAYYEQHGRELPLNINGTAFIRPLSNILEDMKAILSERDVKKRLALDL